MSERATERHTVGRSDLEVTRLGLGTAPLGGLFSHVPDEDAAAVVRRALDRGLRYLDTAPLYGHGTAERRVGAALRDAAGPHPRASYVLSSKVGRLIVETPGTTEGAADGHADGYADAPPSTATFDYTRDGIHRSLQASLERMGLDRIDLCYIHDPDDHEDEALGVAYPALHELREQGVVRAIGVGMNQSRIPTRFVRETDIDAVLLAGRYTLLDQSGAKDLLPACAERGTSVVIGGVYNSGLLADPKPGATYDYQTAPPELVRRAQALARVCEQHAVPLMAAAIQFPLFHPSVATVLTGARSVRELEENVAMMNEDIPDALWTDLAAAGSARYEP